MATPSADDRLHGYARALLSIAEAEGQLDDVEDELFRFTRTVDREPRLREALTDPTLPPDRKKDLLRDLLGGKASSHTISLLGFLVDQGRVKDLARIADLLGEVAAERRNQVVAEVRTAVPLDAVRRERLAQTLSRATGKDVELKVLVDQSIIGGVVARVGDQVFDGTIRRKLELARQQLSSL